MQRGKRNSLGLLLPTAEGSGGRCRKAASDQTPAACRPGAGRDPWDAVLSGWGGHSKDKSRGRVVGQRAGGVAACVCKLQYM